MYLLDDVLNVLGVTSLLTTSATSWLTTSMLPPLGTPKYSGDDTGKAPFSPTALWDQEGKRMWRGEEGKVWGEGSGARGREQGGKKEKRKRTSSTFLQMAHLISNFIFHFSRADIKSRMYKHS